MKYLFSLKPDTNEKSKDDFAESGEPVIPWFPAPAKNVFLSLSSWKFSPCAIVKEVELDLDELFTKLKNMFPGLPDTLHKNYILKTAVAANRLPVDTVVKPVISDNQAQIVVAGSDTIITLWTKQPIE